MAEKITFETLPNVFVSEMVNDNLDLNEFHLRNTSLYIINNN